VPSLWSTVLDGTELFWRTIRHFPRKCQKRKTGAHPQRFIRCIRHQDIWRRSRSSPQENQTDVSGFCGNGNKVGLESRLLTRSVLPYYHPASTAIARPPVQFSLKRILRVYFFQQCGYRSGRVRHARVKGDDLRRHHYLPHRHLRRVGSMHGASGDVAQTKKIGNVNGTCYKGSHRSQDDGLFQAWHISIRRSTRP